LPFLVFVKEKVFDFPNLPDFPKIFIPLSMVSIISYSDAPLSVAL
jgi:hypothetical protein